MRSDDKNVQHLKMLTFLKKSGELAKESSDARASFRTGFYPKNKRTAGEKSGNRGTPKQSRGIGALLFFLGQSFDAVFILPGAHRVFHGPMGNFLPSFSPLYKRRSQALLNRCSTVAIARAKKNGYSGHTGHRGTHEKNPRTPFC